MGNAFNLKCPRCGNTDKIDIRASVWIRVTDDGTDPDEAFDGSHEWGDKSEAKCNACNQHGKVHQFETEEDSDG
jgi:hypothetical protein